MILRLDISVRLRDATSHVATALPRVATALPRVATALPPVLLSTKVDKALYPHKIIKPELCGENGNDSPFCYFTAVKW